MEKYKKGDNIPVFLGESEETYLLVLSYDGDSYEVQVKTKKKIKAQVLDGKVLRLDEADIEELREK